MQAILGPLFDLQDFDHACTLCRWGTYHVENSFSHCRSCNRKGTDILALSFPYVMRNLIYTLSLEADSGVSLPAMQASHGM